MDNVIIERFWRSLKTEETNLYVYTDVREAQRRIGWYIQAYNQLRPHRSLQNRTPDEMYYGRGGNDTLWKPAGFQQGLDYAVLA